MSQRSVLEIHETNVVFWSVYEKCLTETDVSENRSVFRKNLAAVSPLWPAGHHSPVKWFILYSRTKSLQENILCLKFPKNLNAKNF